MTNDRGRPSRAGNGSLGGSLGGSRGGSLPLRLVLLVVGAAILIGVLPFLSGLVGSLILYVVTRPIHERLARLIPPRVSAIVVAVGVFAALLAPGTWLVSTIVAESRDAVRGVRADDIVAWLSRTPFAGYDVTKEIAAAATSMIGWLSSRAFSLVGGATSTLLNVLIALFGLYYLLLGATPLWQRVRRILPVTEQVAALLATRFETVTNALLLGTMLAAAVQGTIVGIGFALVGLPAPVLWGFVTACASVLPLMGSALVWLPGSAILLLSHRPGAALFLFVLGAGVASNIDNLIRPLVYRRVSGIHPMLTLVGAFAGVRMFGLIGAFLGPLILSYFLALIDVYEEAALVDDTIPARSATLAVPREPHPV